MTENNQAKPAPKNPEEIRRRLKEDPNTALIAEQLQVPLDEYIAGVVRFAMNPSALPEYHIMSDAELKARFGVIAPKEAEILKLFDSEVEQATIMDKTDYTDPKVQLVAMPKPPMGETREEDPELKAELQKKLRGNKEEK